MINMDYIQTYCFSFGESSVFFLLKNEIYRGTSTRIFVELIYDVFKSYCL